MIQYRRVLELRPDNILVYCRVAGILRSQGRLNAVIDTCRFALKIKPDCTELVYLMGTALEERGNITQAVDYYRWVLKIRPDILDVQICLARCLVVLGYTDDALEFCDNALKLSPGDENAISIKAGIFHRLGDSEKAYDCLRPHLENNTDNIGILLAYTDMAELLDRNEDAISKLESMLVKRSDLPGSTRSRIHFNLGTLNDAIGEYDAAFGHFKQGNDLKVVEDGPYLYPNVTTMKKYFSRDCLASLPRSGNDSDVPVFVVGMPRSGSTLVEQILSSHPEVYGVGELHYIIEQVFPELLGTLGGNLKLPDCLPKIKQETLDSLAKKYLAKVSEISGDDFTRVVDKMPGNYVYLWLIELLFPRAHVIHCVRNPLDTCLSAYFQNFAESNLFTFNLQSLAKYYKIYKELMDHWKNVLTIKMIDIKYEDLVGNTEDVSRTMLEFCGLEWNERCLQFYKARRFVGTASHQQVRNPIYRKSIGRWKNYEKWLEPLISELERE